MTLDTTTLGGWIAAVLQLIAGVLRLDVDAFYAAVAHPRGLVLAVAVFMVAGLSVGLGQSVVLFANRVPKRRFFIALCGGALVGLVAASLWALTIWLVLRFILATPTSLRAVTVVVALGVAPGILGIFLFLPYLGVIFGWVLRFWVFITILVGVGVVAKLTFWPALLACVLGWLLLELLTRFPLFDLERLRAWVWRLTTGRAQRYEGDDLAAWLAAQARATLTAGDDPRRDSRQDPGHEA